MEQLKKKAETYSLFLPATGLATALLAWSLFNLSA
jgi:hypothetical protein